MIVSKLVPKQGICSLIVESPDDLWTLRRLIRRGDLVTTRSSRVVKREDEYSKTDKERVSVTVAVNVESVQLDRSVDRLRIRGRIAEASDESVTRAGTHSLSVTPGHGLTITKREWTPLDSSILNSARETGRQFLIVTVDRREAAIGLLAGSHLSILSSVDSGASGKGTKETNTQPFFGKIMEILKQHWREGDMIVVAGPGNTKLALANLISARKEFGENCTVVEGFDQSDADGIRSLIRFEGFQKVASDSMLVEVQGAVNEVIRRLATGDRKVAYALPAVKEAAEAGAVDSCVASDNVFSLGVDEEEVVQVLNTVESRGGKVYLADSSLELGKQVSSFGGIVALLRYPIRTV